MGSLCVPKWGADLLCSVRASWNLSETGWVKQTNLVSLNNRETSDWVILGEVGDPAPAKMGIYIHTTSKLKVSSLNTRKALTLDEEHNM